MTMQDMISKIVKMDEEARKINEQAERSITNSNDDICAYREKIRNEYLVRARKRIEKNRVQEKKAAEKQLEESQKRQIKVSAALDKKSEENMDNWVASVVERVVGQ